jgi:hypothetical protein
LILGGTGDTVTHTNTYNVTAWNEGATGYASAMQAAAGFWDALAQPVALNPV